MKATMKIASLILATLALITTSATAASKNQDAAEISAVVSAAGSAFTPDQVTAMRAAASKLNGEGDLTEGQKATIRGILTTARRHEGIAPAGKAKEDAKKFADALEKALGTAPATVAPSTPTPSTRKKASGSLSKPEKVEWEGEDPAAPKITAGHAEVLQFSAKLAGTDAVVTGEDANLFKIAAENAAKFLKGEASTLSDVDAVVLQECGQNIRPSGFGSATKQKLNQKQLLTAINAALEKGGYELVAGSVSSASTAPATTPATPAPATPAPATPAPTTSGVPADPGAAAPAPTVPAVTPAVVPAPATPPPATAPASAATKIRIVPIPGKTAADGLKKESARPSGAVK